MNPEQARSIRFKKRLEERFSLPLLDQYDIEYDDRSFFIIQREQEEEYEEDEEKLIENESEKVEYFGYFIEPFSMKEDREAGVIHENGFVEIKKYKDIKDAWLDSLEETKDPRAKVKNSTIEKRDNKDDKRLSEKDKLLLIEELYELLQPGETPNDFLCRFYQTKPKTQRKIIKNVRKMIKTESNSEQHNGISTDKRKTENKETDNDKENNDEKKALFERIVEICDILSMNGCIDIYNETKGKIQNKLKSFKDKLAQIDPQ